MLANLNLFFHKVNLRYYLTMFFINKFIHYFSFKLHVANKKTDIDPAKLTASSACLGAGLKLVLPCPCASPTLFRNEPKPSIIELQPPRICLKVCSVCCDGARFNSLLTNLYNWLISDAFP